MCRIEVGDEGVDNEKHIYIYNHSIFGTSDNFLEHVLFATCRHHWLYFSPPLEIVVFHGAKLTRNNACKSISFGH